MHAPVTPPTLVLIGLRGSGKSTIGRIVAEYVKFELITNLEMWKC